MGLKHFSYPILKHNYQIGICLSDNILSLILGITGTWEGYTTTNAQIYNRGAFGSGYSISSFSLSSNISSNNTSKLTSDNSQLKATFKGTVSGVSYSMTKTGNFITASNSLINYSAYNKLYITFSYAYLYLYDRYSDTTLSLTLTALNSSGSTIATTAYKTFDKTSGTYDQGATEQTVSVNVSSYNGVGGFKLILYSYRSITSTSGTNTTSTLSHTAYIQRIYLA